MKFCSFQYFFFFSFYFLKFLLGSGTQGIRKCTYGELSPIFLGPNKTKTIFMIIFDTKHRLTDISGFTRDNLDFCLHCFRIFYVSKYRPRSLRPRVM